MAEDQEETQVEETEEKAEGGGSGEERETMDSDAVNKQMEEVEENPPDKLEDWPDGPAKYRTIGGGDASESWEEGPTAKLGPSDVRYYEDGTVTVRGEEVDNPEDFKGDPIPGGPTDPEAPDDPSGLEDDDKGDDADGDQDAAEGADATDGGDEERAGDTKPDGDEEDA
jgi:hypothetical protein